VERFGTATAVNALDFTVKPHRIVGFLGRNGAGKSKNYSGTRTRGQS
jgi:ABC-type multidrug transport system ATPase subunit